MATLSDITGVMPDPNDPEESDELLVNDRKIGIELELEDLPKDYVGYSTKRYPLLAFTHDGSLRNNGVEIVTLPVKGSNIIDALDQIDSFLLTEGQGKASASDRAALHVHIDVRKETTAGLVNLLITYLICEDILFNYCGKERKDSPYCTPMSDYVCSDSGLLNLTSSNRNSVLRAIKGHVKYSAVNFRTVASLGTVEFRIHGSTTDTGRILQWVNILLSLVDFATSTSKVSQEIIDSVCAGPEDLFAEVFRGSMGKFNPDYIPLMLEGARVAQEYYRYKEFPSMEGSLFEKLYQKKQTVKTSSKSRPERRARVVPSAFLLVDEPEIPEIDEDF